MTLTQISAVALASAALFAGQAMAANADAPITRQQVKAKLAEAVRTGNVVAGESSTQLNEMFPQRYPAPQTASSVTREQVKVELAEAVRAGNVVAGESSVTLSQAFPYDYPAQQAMASKSREEVKSELAEAISTGQNNRIIAA